jgi:hypothetical protein
MVPRVLDPDKITHDSGQYLVGATELDNIFWLHYREHNIFSSVF